MPLVPLSALDNALPQLQAARDQIQAFLGDNDENHLRSADQHVDALLVQAGALPAPPFPNGAEGAAKAAEDYARHTRDLVQEFGRAFAALGDQMESQSTRFTEAASATEQRSERATSALEERLETLSEIAEERQAQTIADSQAKIAEVRAEIDSQKARLDQAIAQQQRTFAEEQSRRLDQFSEAQEKRETAFVERTEALTHEMQGKLDALLVKAASSVDELSQQERRAAQIVSITAASNVAEAYIKEGKEQRQQADWWRYGALAFVAILIGYAVFLALVAQPASDSSVGEWLRYLGVKASLGGLIGAPFFYAIGQSGRHRRREEEARGLALELTSFRPFLSELPEQERSKEIIDATKRYFPGQQRSPPSEGL